jgi:hypothetical protein
MSAVRKSVVRADLLTFVPSFVVVDYQTLAESLISRSAGPERELRQLEIVEAALRGRCRRPLHLTQPKH